MIMTLLALFLSAQAVVISDEALVGYSHRPFDPNDRMHQRELLGMNHGVPVVADYPCSDECPGDTMRVIHYDVAPGHACDRIGGVTEMFHGPMGPTLILCVPKTLMDRHRYAVGAWELE